jgi:hypothetical protein
VGHARRQHVTDLAERWAVARRCERRSTLRLAREKN